MKNTTVAMGLWKFGGNITEQQLIELAESFSEDDRYLQVYIRKVSKDQMGVGFTYKLSEDKDHESAYDEYFDKTSDSLKRKFGNDLVGWDLASPVWVIRDSNIN
ncbi:hypothetical protein KC842_01585 [Candidatus Nomurabacteria bacterium]|nr:hypothetical protein [Candidatus Nomurabacteria bacterium]USN94514.1 MAG: hypothetical protein H6791_01990 [Candidatus Nomurabacteria bacterium]